jgi:hypothetical protein
MHALDTRYPLGRFAINPTNIVRSVVPTGASDLGGDRIHSCLNVTCNETAITSAGPNQ